MASPDRGDGTRDVWLSKDIVQDVVESRMGDDVVSQPCWRANRVHIVTCLTDAEVEAVFDSLWEQAELDGRGTRDLATEGREAALSAQAQADYTAAMTDTVLEA